MGYMPIKIESDGTIKGTKVTNADTGQPIGLIRSLEWKISTDCTHPVCIIKLVGASLEANCEAKVEE